MNEMIKFKDNAVNRKYLLYVVADYENLELRVVSIYLDTFSIHYDSFGKLDEMVSYLRKSCELYQVDTLLLNLDNTVALEFYKEKNKDSKDIWFAEITFAYDHMMPLIYELSHVEYMDSSEFFIDDIMLNSVYYDNKEE